MKRSQLSPMPDYFDRYINKCDDVELLYAIQTSIDELDSLPLDKWNALGNNVYAPGKWTVKEILQHLIDTERIFTYRALAFARNETQVMPYFSEVEYVAASNANARSVANLLTELKSVHQSFLNMYETFTPEMLGRTGKGFKGEYSVASIAFCMPGHQRWHLQVIEEKYFSLISADEPLF
jgi:DinB superfamily